MPPAANGDDEEETNEMPLSCQSCYKRTTRRCGACGICVYCSEQCEEAAADKCGGWIACAMHKAVADKWANATDAEVLASAMRPYSLNEYPMHVVMAPYYRFELAEENAIFAVEHFLKFLLAWSPPETSVFTCFGMSVCPTGRNRLSAGLTRLVWAHTTRDAAIEETIKRHTEIDRGILACADDYDGARTVRHWIVVGTPVIWKEPRSKRAIHFDLLELSHNDGEDVVVDVQPLWLQFLDLPTPVSLAKEKCVYALPFKPKGIKPPKVQPGLTKRLVDAAVKAGQPPASAPAAASAPAPAPSTATRAPSAPTDQSTPPPPQATAAAATPPSAPDPAGAGRQSPTPREEPPAPAPRSPSPRREGPAPAPGSPSPRREAPREAARSPSPRREPPPQPAEPPQLPTPTPTESPAAPPLAPPPGAPRVGLAGGAQLAQAWEKLSLEPHQAAAGFRLPPPLLPPAGTDPAEAPTLPAAAPRTCP